jgi:HK97 family phage major capsid protein
MGKLEITNKKLQRRTAEAAAFAAKSININGAYGRDQLTPEMKSFINFVQTGQIDTKAIGTGAASAGVTVPAELHSEVIKKMRDLSVMRKAGAKIYTTSHGNLTVPVVDDTANAVNWVAEHGQIPDSADPDFTSVDFTPYKMARIIRMSNEALSDNGVNLVDEISSILAEYLAYGEDAAFIQGTGTGRPEGLFTNSSIVLTASAAADAAALLDELLNLAYTVPANYRRQGAAYFMRSDLVKIVHKAKDSQGRYLWADSVQAGEPARLNGFPVWETDAITAEDSDASTQIDSSVVFGATRYYGICDGSEMQIERLNERYAEFDETGFRAKKRTDGKVMVPEAFAKLTSVEHNLT